MKNYFYTESLNVAAWLLSKGFDIKTKFNIDNKVVFYFERSEELNNAIDNYNKNIELKKFITSFKRVREVIRNK